MSSSPKKEKKVPRRIVPQYLIEEKYPEPPTPKKKESSPKKLDKWEKKAEKHMKKAGMDKGRSVTYDKHLASVHDKDYLKELEKRAVEKGYEKAKKPRKNGGKSYRGKKADDRDHGTMHEHMHSFGEFIKAFAKLKAHGKGVNMYDYLKKNYEKGLWLSSATKRWRKAK